MPPPLRPRLVGLDLDGTILDSQGELREPVRAALLALHAAGVHVAFLTGRRPLTARMRLDGLDLPAYVATNSGCLLWRLPGWQQIARQLFPAELVLPVAELLEPYSANFYVDASRAGFEFFYLDRQPSPELDIYMERYGGNSRRVSDPAELAGYEITQVAMPGKPELVEELQGRIITQFDGQLLALSVRWPLMPAQSLEVFHPLANKGGALAHFAELLGVAQSETVAVGDDTNDLAMLEWAGWGVAMPHSGPDVRGVAQQTLTGDGPEALAEFLGSLLELS
jgi:Cof subfamily protein (haloacid dehalogenase superfamily)